MKLIVVQMQACRHQCLRHLAGSLLSTHELEGRVVDEYPLLFSLHEPHLPQLVALGAMDFSAADSLIGIGAPTMVIKHPRLISVQCSQETDRLSPAARAVVVRQRNSASKVHVRGCGVAPDADLPEGIFEFFDRQDPC